MLKGQTVLREKLKALGFDEDQIETLLPFIREWLITEIIQVDEYITLTGEPYDTLNKMYDISNQYKKEMRARVKSQTK